MEYTSQLSAGQRVRRKLLITVAEWSVPGAGTSTVTHRTILGKRTEDSSIELNADIETTTDVLGITYTDVNKTEPQQDFDPHFVMGGEDLDTYLLDAVLNNDIDKYNNVFNIYIITAWIDDKTGSGTSESHKYKTIKHSGCSIIATNIGGDSYVQMNLEVHFSNDITSGYCTTLDATNNSWQFQSD